MGPVLRQATELLRQIGVAIAEAMSRTPAPGHALE
jgi:hypothetical protein